MVHGAPYLFTGYRLFLIEAIGTYADLYFLCERHPRLWNRRLNSVDLKLFIQDQALLQSADAKGKRRSLMYNAVCLEFKTEMPVNIRFHARLRYAVADFRRFLRSYGRF